LLLGQLDLLLLLPFANMPPHLSDPSLSPPPPPLAFQFEEMYEQRRREVNKEFEKYQKQIKAAKKSGSKAAADKVEKGVKHKAKLKAKAGGASGVDAAAADAPRQWNDYTVHFEFPEPTELPPPLLQLIDAE
jgi:ATP-binding cassette subfamily F protein 1